MSDPEISVIAPCFNEEGNIAYLVRRVAESLEPLGVGYELICIDDCSTDDTLAKIRQAEAEHEFVRGAHHEKNGGIVKGWRTGYELSRGRMVVTIDADLQYRPEDMISMYEAIQADPEADLVQGWRQKQVERSAVRRFMTAGLSWLLNVTFGMKLRDNKSGYIMYKREVLGDLLTYAHHFRYFQHFVSIAANALKYRIIQVPVVFDRRHSGESFITNPWAFSFESALDIPRALWLFRIHKPKPALKGN